MRKSRMMGTPPVSPRLGDAEAEADGFAHEGEFRHFAAAFGRVRFVSHVSQKRQNMGHPSFRGSLDRLGISAVGSRFPPHHADIARAGDPGFAHARITPQFGRARFGSHVSQKRRNMGHPPFGMTSFFIRMVASF